MDFHPSSGGTFTTISSFVQAIQNSVISFSSHAPPTLDMPSRAVQVELAKGIAGRLYGLPARQALKVTSELVSETDLFWLHVLYRFPAQWIRQICGSRRKPYIFVAHGSLDPYVFTYRRLRKYLFMHTLGRRILDDASRIVFSTWAEFRKAQRWINPAKAVVMHWPVELRYFSDLETRRHSVCQRLELPPDTRLLLWVGRLHPMKRPVETAQAFARADADNCVLLMIGPDEVYSREQCRAFCKRQGIKHVYWLGPVFGQEKEELFAAAHGFISYSHRENFGYTTADALACGKPVILSPGNDLAGDINHTECGWFTKGERPSEISEAIKAFSKASRQTLDAAGRRGQDWAAENLRMESFRATLQNLVAATIEESSQRAATPRRNSS